MQLTCIHLGGLLFEKAYSNRGLPTPMGSLQKKQRLQPVGAKLKLLKPHWEKKKDEGPAEILLTLLPS